MVSTSIHSKYITMLFAINLIYHNLTILLSFNLNRGERCCLNIFACQFYLSFYIKVTHCSKLLKWQIFLKIQSGFVALFIVHILAFQKVVSANLWCCFYLLVVEKIMYWLNWLCTTCLLVAYWNNNNSSTYLWRKENVSMVKTIICN